MVVAHPVDGAVLVDHRTAALKMILEEIEHAVVSGITGAAQGVAFIVVRGSASPALVDASNLEHGHTVDCALDAVTIRIVDKAGFDPIIGRASGVAGESAGQPIRPVILETLLLAGVV